MYVDSEKITNTHQINNVKTATHWLILETEYR
ncbi:Uncharacterised protein [Vibrio cholerae]|nr:Uncharacterised protein [Vibrio cholerae]